MEINKKSAQGIGTLIIFIALILVAAIAATVLVQTSSSLQSKSLDVGKETQERISNSLDVIQIRSEDASDSIINGSGVDTLFITLRLDSGSADIRLEDLIVDINTDTGVQSATYVSGPTTGANTFNETYKRGVATTAGYITRDDVVELNVPVLNDIEENEEVEIQIIHTTGMVKPVRFTAPSSMRKVNEILYP